MIYGTGGIGKTTLACLAPGKVALADGDESMADLKDEFERIDVPLPLLIPATNWQTLCDALKSDGWNGIRTIGIDVTVAEEWCIASLLKTVKVGNSYPTSLEDYGYGKDVRYVYEHFLPLLGHLDRHVRQGRNVLLIAHECKPEEVNPTGQNYLRFEPRLRTSKRGENSIRLRVKEWCSFVGYIAYDASINKDKKAEGSGTRTMYLTERPSFMAKQRGGLPESINIEHGVSPWEGILK